MSRDFSASLLRVTALTSAVTWLGLMFAACGIAKETDPGGKDADTEAEIVFEPTSEGKAAADNPGTEEPIDFDSKRPSILGMTVIEDSDGRARVIDVGASSPAWDAGIRKDDVIVSLHGVKAKSFQAWTDGVRKVVADTKAGQTIPVQVLRDGSPLDMQVRISEQKDMKPPRPVRTRQQDQNIVVNQAPNSGEQPLQPGGVPYPVGAGGYGGFGVIDNGTASDPVPTRAAAHLMAVNNRTGTAPAPGPIPMTAPPPGNDPTNATGAVQPPGGTAPGTFPSRPVSPTGAAPGTNGVSPGTFPNNTTGQTATGVSGNVGTAEFADAAGGMMAMVTLGGLPPGTYRVGIGEFNGATGGFGPNNAPLTDRNNTSPRETSDRSRQLRNAQQTPPARQGQPVRQPGQNPGDFELYNPGQQSAPGANTPAGGQPVPAPPAGGAGTGGAASGGTGDGGAASAPPRSNFYVLAQVTSAASGQSPPNQAVGRNPAATPAVTNPNGRNPVGQAGNPNQARQLPPPQLGQATQPNQPGAVPPANAGLGTGGQFGIELGTVTVRPNGGGQLQQLIEGIRVANVVGQSVVVVPADISVARGSRAAAQRQAAAAQNAGSVGVVASGVIQLVSNGQSTTQQPVPTNRNTSTTGTAPENEATQPVPQQSPTGTDRTQR